ncbi:hypothetical protein LCGC14_2338700 [marine sediment metagenome]|uniref:Uncharacterized protein n=1 Tax=marine sediment metagenome TaxID=412755 RepID=A0A0F9D074_9ZZZZ
MPGPIIREYDKRLYKKCIKCRGWYPREDILDDADKVVKKRGFGKHADSSDGLQSICFLCKNRANNTSRERNVTARVRHHTGTRCLTQLGKELTPKGFVANLEDFLGYKINALVKALSKDLKAREGRKRRLRDALNEGYHIDHKTPLSSFEVVYRDKHQIERVDWDIFRECWAISNLQAIPADENLAKGAKHEQAQEPTEENKAAEETDGEAAKEGAEGVSAASIEISANT